ncbi:MAG: hypothetical protein KBG49_12680 [Spirochaetes bacterium]|jgi:lysophospholipase L1-like esterase|nr:hypothetical protein [Spirochaetota bacterium]
MGLIQKLIEKGLSEVKIAGFGDSLTYGWLVSKGYLDFLKEILKEKYPDIKLRIANLGVPGDTARDGLRRANELVKEKPDITIIQFALNDAFSGFTPKDFRANMAKIADFIYNNTTSKIIFSTSVPVAYPYENSVAELFYKEIESLAMEMNTTLAKVHEYWKSKISAGEFTHGSLVQSDGVHPLEQGYRLMAECIAQEL